MEKHTHVLCLRRGLAEYEKNGSKKITFSNTQGPRLESRNRRLLLRARAYTRKITSLFQEGATRLKRLGMNPHSMEKHTHVLCLRRGLAEYENNGSKKFTFSNTQGRRSEAAGPCRKLGARAYTRNITSLFQEGATRLKRLGMRPHPMENTPTSFVCVVDSRIMRLTDRKKLPFLTRRDAVQKRLARVSSSGLEPIHETSRNIF